MTALIDSGAQLSSICSGFCELLTLEVHPLGRQLELEGTGGSAIPYLGYIEVNLQIPGIKGYNEDILLLVILTMNYYEKVLVLVRSKIIDWVIGMMTKWELMRALATWKQVHFGAVMSGAIQLPHTDSKEDGEVGKGLPSPQALTLQHPGGPAWMMFGDLSIPLRRLPSLHVGPLVYMVTLVFRNTACGSTCLPNQHEAPSHLPPWY